MDVHWQEAVVRPGNLTNTPYPRNMTAAEAGWFGYVRDHLVIAICRRRETAEVQRLVRAVVPSLHTDLIRG